MATGAIASSGAWVPTLAVYQKTPNNNQKPQTQKRQGTWVPVPGCLYMRGPWVLIPGCSPDEAGEGGRSKGARIRQGGDVPAPAVARSSLPKKRGRHAGAAWRLVGAAQSQTPGARGYSDAALAQLQEVCGP